MKLLNTIAGFSISLTIGLPIPATWAGQGRTTAETPPSSIVSGRRVLHFPGDRSVGRVKLWPLPLEGELPVDRKRATITDVLSDAQFVGLARGDVVVPADRGVVLSLSCTYARDLDCLSAFGPDDLFMLRISSVERFPMPEAYVYTQIKHLRSLRFLEVHGQGLTGRGLHALAEMGSLRGLCLSGGARLGETELTELPELPSVEWFDCYLGVTDNGVKNLARLRNLKVLRLQLNRVRGPGLADLARLPRLEHLCLWADTGPTDVHVQHLAGLTQLKRLTLWGSPGPTDRSLAFISKLAGLEELTFIGVPGLTDEGTRQLGTLERLRYVELDGRPGDATIRALSRLPQLEAIVHVCPGAEGMAILGECHQLKNLGIVFWSADSGGPATAGLEHLAGLPLLEELSLTGLQIGDSDLKHLASLSHLKHLLLMTKNVTNEGLASLCKLQSLESLSLHMVQVTKAGVNQLNSLKNLKSLSVRGHPLLKGGDDATLNLSGLTNLESLCLLNNNFGLRNEDLAFLPALTRLTWLDLAVLKPQTTWGADLPGVDRLERRGLAVSYNPVSSDALKYVSGLTRLRYLRMPMMDCSNADGFLYLQGLRNLENLDLKGRIPETVLPRLNSLPPSVAILDIRSTEPISGKAISSLRQSLPHLWMLDVEQVGPDGWPLSRPMQMRSR